MYIQLKKFDFCGLNRLFQLVNIAKIRFRLAVLVIEASWAASSPEKSRLLQQLIFFWGFSTEIIQGRKLSKGGNYIKKYGMLF